MSGPNPTPFKMNKKVTKKDDKQFNKLIVQLAKTFNHNTKVLKKKLLNDEQKES